LVLASGLHRLATGYAVKMAVKSGSNAQAESAKLWSNQRKSSDPGKFQNSLGLR